MQLAGELSSSAVRPNSFQTGAAVLKNEGFSGLYKGLSAGLFRQITYTTTRLGVYNSLSNHFAPTDGSNVPFVMKFAFGVIAGGMGAMVGTPGDLALIRMMADGRLPPEQRRNYKHIGDALTRIVRSDGFFGMWRGCTPTVVRAMALNSAQLAGYSQTKEALIKSGLLKDGFGCHFTASLFAGFLATAVSIPADLLKTRYQNMRVVNGVPEYKGVLDVLARTVKAEGALALWKGFFPYFVRLGPHTIIALTVLEQFTSMYKKHLM